MNQILRVSKITALVLSLGIAIGACGTSSTSPPSQTGSSPTPALSNKTLVVGSTVFPPTLDPTANAAAAIDEVVDYNVLQHLVQIAPNGTIVAVLATSWKLSSDKKTYTFQIRHGVKFSNGDPLTAADVVYSINRVIASNSTYPYAKVFGVESVKQINNFSVAVTLTQPSWEWLFNLAAYSNGVILDSKAISSVATDPIGTGPFKVTGEVTNYSISLARNPSYFGTAPGVGGVTFRYFQNPNAESAALQSGQIDVIDNLGAPTEVSTFKNDPAFKVISGPTNGKVQVTLNNAYGPLQNKLVRQAIAYATNKKAIINVASGGYGIPLGSDSVPADPFYLDLSKTYPYNPAKAKALLSQAGYPNGFNLTLTLPPYYYAQLAGPLVASELSVVGIHTTISEVQFPLWLSQVFEAGNYQATIIDHAEARDIGNYGTAGYYWHYGNTSEVAQMLSVGNSAPTQALWISAYRGVLRKITADAVNDWLYVLPKLMVEKKDVVGLSKAGYTESFDLSHVSFGGHLAPSAISLGYLP